MGIILNVHSIESIVIQEFFLFHKSFRKNFHNNFSTNSNIRLIIFCIQIISASSINIMRNLLKIKSYFFPMLPATIIIRIEEK